MSDMSSEFKDKICLVTGGSSGIGRGIAIEFGASGATVIIADIQEKSKIGKYHDTDIKTTTSEEIKKNGGKSEFFECDCSDEKNINELVSHIENKYGRLDILVNNAGMHIPGSIEEIGVEEWDKVVNLNFRGIFILSKRSLNMLKKSKSGRIINIASIHAFHGVMGPAYAPSKSAVVNLTKNIAIALGKYNITVNCICPGYIETPIQDYNTQKEISDYKKTLPLNRFGKPSDIANAALFFASNKSDWITGTYLIVDGGDSAA